MFNTIIISHKFLPQPDDDLVLYLNSKKVENIMHVSHAFSDSPNRASKCKWYRKGVLYKEWKTKDYKKFPEAFIYLKEFLFTVSRVIKSNLIWDKSICMDGMCTFFGLFLKAFRKVKSVNYWAMDFVPENRFKSGVKNFFYHSINKFGYRNADEMWDLSPRMAEARERFLGIKRDSYKVHKVVPYGVWLDRIKRYSYKECEKNTLVFMGHILEKQGVQLVIDAIPKIIRCIPGFRFKIIGSGSYQDVVIKKIRDMKLEKHVIFKGVIENPIYMEDEIAKSCVAIAPYIEKLDKWTKYADPGKVKTYLACGVPVLLTDVPWNTRNIEESGCGKVITENSDNIAENVVEMMDGDKNQEYRDNSLKCAKCFDYNNIFKSIEI